MAKKQLEYPSVIPLNTPEIQEFQSLGGNFQDWIERSKWMEKRSDEAAKWCLRKAYFDSDDLGESFYQYVKDFIADTWGEYNQLDPRAHRKICSFIVDPYKRKMLQASRGSQKSTIGAMGYSTWRVAREYLIRGQNRLRILFASENLHISKRNMTWAKQTMEWNQKYIELAGDHRGINTDRQMWGIEGITSQFRTDPSLAEPTVSPIGIKAGRTGFHFDLIICDDLQAETYSITAEQIEAVDTFFKLLFSMLVQDGTGEFMILGTRWHNDDIYNRIEERNVVLKDKGLVGQTFKIMKIPARDKKTGSSNFPTIYTESLLDEIRAVQGARIYANQYMLEALDDDEQKLTSDYVQFWNPKMLENRKLNVYITCDLAFTEAKKNYKGGRHDYTVILTIGIDEDWNYYVLDWFRERCSKRTAITEMYRQWDQSMKQSRRPISVLLQKYDRSQIAETIDQYGHTVNRRLPIEWVSYPPNTKKLARIDAHLVPLFEAMSWYLHPTMQWFLNVEYYPYPMMKYDDCLDAMSNVGYVSNPAIQPKKVVTKTYEQQFFARLMKGQGPSSKSPDDWKHI